MKVIVNDKEENLKENSTLSEFLSEKSMLNKKSIVITVNGEVIPQDKYNTISLKENDNVKIYTFVQGG